ncbi:fructose-bisphosphatase class II [Kineosporia sp. R_H_3]|uniref:fructose-bisphosphatase class II n=1 Tax=Kineosporia sp. R_H_3 TaxID=1961848 RepID=UPI000B4BDE92|nr:fructose-bisphosphatase class II [Kineosporia sp. R_H_3]
MPTTPQLTRPTPPPGTVPRQDPAVLPGWLDAAALGCVAATEAAVLAAVPWIGRGDKLAVDAAAVAAMRAALAAVPIDGTVAIGEGEKDEAPMIHNGERVGTGAGPRADVAVDPVDGTTLTAHGVAGAVAVLALAPAGSVQVPTDVFYMERLVCGPAGHGVVDIARSPEDNVRALAAATGRTAADVTVAVLDRPRHVDLVARLRAAGARVHVFPDGDVVAAVLAAAGPARLPGATGGADLFLGVGGTPEGVIAACAAASLGGVFQGRLAPRTDDEHRAARRFGPPRTLGVEDLVRGGHGAVVLSGLTGGDLLPAVTASPAGGRRTTSLVLTTTGVGPRLVVTDHPAS